MSERISLLLRASGVLALAFGISAPALLAGAVRSRPGE